MSRNAIFFLILISISLFAANIVTRDSIDDKYKWNTNHIYSGEDVLNADVAKIEKFTREIKLFEGKLSDRKVLLEVLATFFSATEVISNLDTYASINRDVDMKNSTLQSLVGRIEEASSAFMAASSFLEPELLSLPKEIMEKHGTDPEFSDYDRFLTKILRSKKHTLSKSSEKLLAQIESVKYGNYEIYSAFSTTDIPNVSIKLKSGEDVVVTKSIYGKLRQSTVREDRKTAADAYLGNYDKYKNTIAAMLNYQIKFYVTGNRLRNFNDSLQAEMHEQELPEDFYSKLTGNIREIVPALHNYLKLKKDRLGLPDFALYDASAPIVSESVIKEYSYEQGTELVLKSMSKMTPEYRDNLKEAMTPGGGWIDVFETDGKRGGAYCAGRATKAHPYILLNFNGTFDAVSTLSHEMGHGMHSWFSNKYQPYPEARYSHFVAEVASIFNEIMLINHMIDNAKTDEEKMFLIAYYLDTIKGTVFTQSLFAEFEDAVYKRVEKGETLTADYLTDEYFSLFNYYYGGDSGVMKIEKKHAMSWAYIPHFYYHYYVYQYVVGYLGALTLATQVYEGTLTPDKYIDNFLKAGSSKPPLEILKAAGADLTSKEPYTLLKKVFDKRLGELRELLKKDAKSKL